MKKEIAELILQKLNEISGDVKGISTGLKSIKSMLDKQSADLKHISRILNRRGDDEK